jgi:hypothetical protein
LLDRIASIAGLPSVTKRFSSGASEFHWSFATSASPTAIFAFVSRFAFFKTNCIDSHPPSAWRAFWISSWTFVFISPVFGSNTIVFQARFADVISSVIFAIDLAVIPDVCSALSANLFILVCNSS